jgi:hypothetical protein
MTNLYRAMCAELTDAELANAARKALDSYRYATELPYFLWEDSNEYEPLMLAIRAAIAADRARALLAQPEPEVPTYQEMQDLASHCVKGSKSIEWVIQTAIARWGRLTAQPVPVSERLPGSEDCDEQERCWWFDDDDEKWCLDTPYIGARLLCWTHWLPYHAIPNLPNPND